jgi:homospermidine synthase
VTPFVQPKLAKFAGSIVLLGWGGMGSAMLPLLLRHLDVTHEQVTVIEKDDKTTEFRKQYPRVGYVVEELTKINFSRVLGKYVSEGGLVVDLATDIDCIDMLRWCRTHGVLYINTSIERWATEPDEAIRKLPERTLWNAHRELRASVSRWPQGSPTCIVTHGANPGLVSHFTKAALLDIAKAMELDAETPTTRAQWAMLMKRTGTQVIQIAERDTQIINRPKEPNEFVCSWSCEGFWAEGRAPAELGWGTHEPSNPAGGALQLDDSAAYLKQPGVNTLVRSWVPLGGAFTGFLIQHSEAITISDYFSTPSFRPTVYYAYQPIDAAIASVHEMRGLALEMQDRTRIAKNEIVSGIDELGVLLLGHGKNAWWYGSQLGIDEARRLMPGQNATALQVVASMLGAIVWAIKNPREGYCEPEDLPFDEVLRMARPYLGPIASVASDWRPLDARDTLFTYPKNVKVPFAFENFRL